MRGTPGAGVASGHAAPSGPLGDYHRFATELIWHFGAELVADMRHRARDARARRRRRHRERRAAGGASAARTVDRRPTSTPAQLDAGRREAEADGARDRVGRGRRAGAPVRRRRVRRRHLRRSARSSPPTTRAVAAELRRVCRPGGTIGMINFTPEGLAADFFAVFAPVRCRPRARGRRRSGAASRTSASSSAAASSTSSAATTSSASPAARRLRRLLSRHVRPGGA